MAARTKKEMGPSIWDLQGFAAGGPEGHSNDPTFCSIAASPLFQVPAKLIALALLR